MLLRICTVLTWLVTALPVPAWAQDQPQSSGDVAAVAPRVILYEEDANDPQGTRMIGSVVWHTEMETPGAGEPPELVVRADVEIPDRAMSVTWKLSRNTDPAGSASHIIDIVFELPQGFRSGGIANVPGILT